MQHQQSASLRYFEILSLATLALGVIISGMQYDNMIRDTALLGGERFVIIVQFLILLFVGAMIFLISRKKSNIAKWIFVVFFILGVPISIPNLAKMFDAGFVGVLSSIQFLMSAVAVYLLFQPDARAAFKGDALKNQDV